MARVKGITVTTRLRFVKERFGDEGLQRLLSALPPEDRAVIDDHILPHAWVPFSVFTNVNRLADQFFGTGDLSLCVEMGRYGARVNIPTLFKLFFRLGSPKFLLGRSAKLWSAHYDTGRMTIVDEKDSAVLLRIEDFDVPDRTHCLSVLGWIVEGVTLTGVQEVRVDEPQCRARGDETCDLLASWRPP